LQRFAVTEQTTFLRGNILHHAQANPAQMSLPPTSTHWSQQAADRRVFHLKPKSRHLQAREAKVYDYGIGPVQVTERFAFFTLCPPEQHSDRPPQEFGFRNDLPQSVEETLLASLAQGIGHEHDTPPDPRWQGFLHVCTEQIADRNARRSARTLPSRCVLTFDPR
jgi:hypothetical protein